MIGLALVSAFGVLAASISASIDDVVERQLGADYIVSNGAQMPFSDDVAKRAAAVEGVESVVRQRFANAKINNDKTFALATDTKALTDAVKIEFIQGDAAGLTGDAMIIDEPTAEAKKLAVGDTVDFTMVGGTKKVSIAGIYKPAQFLGPYVVTMPTYDALGGLQRDSFVYVNLKEGADAAVAGPALETALKDYPTVNLQDQTAFKEDQQGQVDQLLLLIYALLFLAIVIAVLGIINTLALSVIERTREIGLLRAIGLNRPQLRRMVTLESVVIALLGAVLGMVLGLVFGTAMQKVLSGQGIEQLAIPYGRLVIFMVVAAVIGVLAALWPAYRASKLDVLKAITTE
jgi:putative ABC transport system permease protein